MVGVDHPQQGGPVKDDNDIWSWETDYSAMNSLVLGGERQQCDGTSCISSTDPSLKTN